MLLILLILKKLNHTGVPYTEQNDAIKTYKKALELVNLL